MPFEFERQMRILEMWFPDSWPTMAHESLDMGGDLTVFPAGEGT